MPESRNKALSPTRIMVLAYVSALVVVAVSLLADPNLAVSGGAIVTGILVTAGLGLWLICQQIGLVSALRLFFTCTFFGFIFEWAGVNRQGIFGPYEYTSVLGWQIGGVPVVIPLAWFAVALTSFALVTLVADKLDIKNVAAIMLMSAAGMVLYDIPIEFLAKYVWQTWTWSGTGFVFGVPNENFVGWFVVACVIFMTAWPSWKKLLAKSRGLLDLRLVVFSALFFNLFLIILHVT